MLTIVASSAIISCATAMKPSAVHRRRDGSAGGAARSRLTAGTLTQTGPGAR